jgi:hypothetical protein
MTKKPRFHGLGTRAPTRESVYRGSPSSGKGLDPISKGRWMRWLAFSGGGDFSDNMVSRTMLCQ